MILEVDIGNTRVKWRLIQDGLVEQSSSGLSSLLFDESDERFSGLNEIFMDAAGVSVDKVSVASVVPSCHELFTLWSESYCNVTPVFAGVKKRSAGVVNAYDLVSQMGVDRWMALLAANSKYAPPCVVIDAGSAITIDLLAVGGKHLGGYIVPGLNMMCQSLFKETGKVRVAKSDYPLSPQRGTSTERAVLSGLALMLLAFVRRAMADLAAFSGEDGSVVVTGGNGAYLADLLREDSVTDVVYDQDLVLDGLSLAIDDNDDEGNV